MSNFLLLQCIKVCVLCHEKRKIQIHQQISGTDSSGFAWEAGTY